MDDFSASLPLGTRLNELEIVRVLGIGGFGITYLAHDTNLGREVAIKEYFPGDFAFRQNTLSITPRSEQHAENFQWGLQRFLEEARILAHLNHPSIVKVTRFFEAYGSAYIVMQYIAGRPLSEEIQEKGALSESRVKAIVMALMDGLEQVHGANLLHRDIKPGNVMVQPDETPVLIDFGAARNISSQHSRTMTAVLTPGYAPIEQYGSRGQQGPWTDIYSLGALAYKCLTGVIAEDATDRFREDQLQPVSQMASEEISEPFARAIGVALNVMESARPQSIPQWREIFEESTSGASPAEQDGPSLQRVSGRESQESSDEPRLHGLVGTRKSRALRRAGSKGIRRFYLFQALGLLGLVAMMAVVSQEHLVDMLPWTNDAPVADAGNNQIVSKGNWVVLDGKGSSDPDSSDLSYAWKQKSGKLVWLIDADKAQARFKAPPVITEENLGMWAFTLTVSDGSGGVDSDEVTIIAEDINAKIDDQGTTRLHLAARVDSAEVTKLLLDAGANVNATTDYGSTPLHGAAWADSAEVAKLLLDAGANVDATTDYGSTPLSLAVKKDSAEVARLLQEAGARK